MKKSAQMKINPTSPRSRTQKARATAKWFLKDLFSSELGFLKNAKSELEISLLSKF